MSDLEKKKTIMYFLIFLIVLLIAIFWFHSFSKKFSWQEIKKDFLNLFKNE